MTIFPYTFGVNRISSQILLRLTATLAKGFFIYAIVRLFLGESWGLSPAHRHLFWFIAVASCLLIPALS